MKKFLGILVLGLFLITPSRADDIRDFQIEGMSLGDSLLDYFSESEINNNSWINSKRSFGRTIYDFETGLVMVIIGWLITF